MCPVISIILLAFVVQVHSNVPFSTHMNDLQDSMDNLVDDWVNKLLERKLQVSTFHDACLDDVMLGKPGQLAISICKGPIYSRPRVFNGGAAPCKLRVSRSRRDCLSAMRRDNSVQSQSATVQPLGRRHAGLAVALGIVAQPMLALAQDESQSAAAVDDGFIDGPEGLKYRDLVVGDLPSGREAPRLGSFLAADYVLKIADTKNEIDNKKAYVFTAGNYQMRGLVSFQGFDLTVLGLKGKMEPMKPGGTRQALIPPKLGFGEGPGGCAPFPPGSNCVIPAMSTLELTITLL